MKQNKNNILFLILSIFMAIGLSGCFKEMKPISVSAEKIEISGVNAVKINETKKMTATITPANMVTGVKWTVDNSEIAVISGDGSITGKKIGTAVITATTANGKKAVCSVSVVSDSALIFGGYAWTPSDSNSWKMNGDMLELASDGSKGFARLIRLEGQQYSDFDIEYEFNKNYGEISDGVLTCFRADKEYGFNKIVKNENSEINKPDKMLSVDEKSYVVKMTPEYKEYLVIRIGGNNSPCLKDRTSSEYIKGNNNWNKVRIVTNGNKFYYYINNKLIWCGSDSYYTSGYVMLGIDESGGRIPSKVQYRNLKIKSIQGIERVSIPAISPASGTYTTTQAVSITCATTGATIKYTMDGTEPTETSPEYQGSFTVTQTTMLKAKAFKGGMVESLSTESSINILHVEEATLDTWITSNITTGSGNWYYADIKANLKYKVDFSDLYTQTYATPNLYGKITVYDSDMTTIIAYASFSRQLTIPVSSTGKRIFIKIEPYYSSATGRVYFKLNQGKPEQTHTFSGYQWKTFDATWNVIDENTIEGNSNGSLYDWKYLKLNNNNYYNYTMEFEVNKLSGNLDNSIGIFYKADENLSELRADVNNNLNKIEEKPENDLRKQEIDKTLSLYYYNLFGIANGKYKISNQSYTIQNWTDNSNVKTGYGTWNKIKMVVFNYTVSIYCNEVLLYTYYNYGSYNNNIYIGYYDGGTAEQVRFRNFKIGVLEQVLRPEITPESAVFTTEQTVNISCATTGATIRYTTDGAEPNQSSSEYTGSFKVSQTTTIKAKVFKEDMFASETAQSEIKIVSMSEIKAGTWVTSNVTTSNGNWYYADLKANTEYKIDWSNNYNKIYGAPDISGYIKVFESDGRTQIMDGSYQSPITIPSSTYTKRVYINVAGGTGTGYLRLREPGVEKTYTFSGKEWKTFDSNWTVLNENTIEGKSDGTSNCWNYLKLNNWDNKNFSLEFEVNKLSGSIDNPLGVFFRAGDNVSEIQGTTNKEISQRSMENYKINKLLQVWDYNLFEIADGKYKYLNQYNIIQNWTSNSNVNGSLNSWNKIKIMSYNNLVMLYCNNVLLASIPDYYNNYKNNIFLGYFDAGTSEHVQFRNFTIGSAEPVSKPVISPATGIYTSEQAVTISSATTGAAIRYTTDGTEPTQTSTEYTGAFAVSQTTTIKAKAYKNEMFDSETDISAISIVSMNEVTPNTWITSNITTDAGNWYYADILANTRYKIDWSDNHTLIYGSPDIDGIIDVYNSDGITRIVNSDDSTPLMIPKSSTAKRIYINVRAYSNGNRGTVYLKFNPEQTYTFSGYQWKTNDTTWSVIDTNTIEGNSYGTSGSFKHLKLNAGNKSNFKLEFEASKLSGNLNNAIYVFFRSGENLSEINPIINNSTNKLVEKTKDVNILKKIEVHKDFSINQYYAYGIAGGSYIFVSQNAVLQQPTSNSSILNSLNAWNKLRVTAYNGSISLYCNDVLLKTFTDYSNNSGNIYIGYADAGTTERVQFRNFTVSDFSGQVVTPAITPATGTYATAQSVTMSCGTEGATTRYTTDDSEPVSTSAEYTGAFTVSQTTIIKAKAFKDGLAESQTAVSVITIGSSQVTGTGGQYEHINASGNFTFKLENLANKDVTFIFTNTSTGAYSYPSVGANFTKTTVAPVKQAVEMDIKPKGTYGKPEIDDFNNNPFKYPKQGMSLSEYKAFKSTMPAVEKYAVGNTETFNDYNGTTTTATLRKVISANGKNLYVWVDNDCWYVGGTKTNRVNQSMVDAFAPKFLNTGTNDDIYEWVSNICGSPWGPHSYPTQYIDGNNNDIHIWLTDIDRDNSTTGGICGYFWGANNALKTNYSQSNEKIMFAIDAVMFATPENGTWELTDFWPQFMISALAHEFQHMIMFYQKPILRNTNTEAWLNEMSSQCIEDLVSDKILANGPRGVAYNDQTAGQTGNNRGRLPLYNRSNAKSLTRWDQDGDSYSRTYALGAYLIRNYGGAGFVQKLVQNNYGDQQAIVDAISANGYTGLGFDDVIKRFGTANILSSSTDVDAGYLYNKGTWVTSEVNGANYNLGSINLYNYLNTPSVYNSMPYGNQESTSNVYYNAGNTLSGTKEWTISNLNPNVKMTVVVK